MSDKYTTTDYYLFLYKQDRQKFLKRLQQTLKDQSLNGKLQRGYMKKVLKIVKEQEKMEERDYVIILRRKSDERGIARWDCDKCTEDKINRIMEKIDNIWIEECLQWEEKDAEPVNE